MVENVYEGLFILDANRYGRDPGKVSGRVNELVEAQGGSLLVSRMWEERRLAFPIRGQRKGTYWLTYFRLAGENVTPLNESVQREDNILRHLVLKVDPRIVEALVSHAQAPTEAANQAEVATAAAAAPKSAP